MSFFKPFFLLPLLLTGLAAQAQCEDLKPNTGRDFKWRTAYREHFELPKAARLIRADSVLIAYLDRERTDMDYECAYANAEAFAVRELRRIERRLEGQLKGSDKSDFTKAQKAWDQFYAAERTFVLHTFPVYANQDKYSLGTVENRILWTRLYELVRQRTMMLENYIQDLSGR